MRWAMALEVDIDEDLTDSETDDSESDDSESDYDSDSDSEYDSDEEESESEGEEERDHGDSSEGSARWTEQNVNVHEWTMPANTLLPVNMQQLFREAAKDKNVDINQRIQEALMAGRLQVPPNPAAS